MVFLIWPSPDTKSSSSTLAMTPEDKTSTKSEVQSDVKRIDDDNVTTVSSPPFKISKEIKPTSSNSQTVTVQQPSSYATATSTTEVSAADCKSTANNSSKPSMLERPSFSMPTSISDNTPAANNLISKPSSLLERPSIPKLTEQQPSTSAANNPTSSIEAAVNDRPALIQNQPQPSTNTQQPELAADLAPIENKSVDNVKTIKRQTSQGWF